METKKFNIGLEVSRNFDKVILSIVDEPISYDDTEELKGKIRSLFLVLQAEVDLQFMILGDKK